MATALPTPKPSRNARRLTLRSLRILLPATYLLLVFLGIGGLILWAGLRMQFAAISQASQDLDLQTRLIASGVKEPFERWEELEQETDDEGEGYTAQPQPQDPTLTRLVTSAAENIDGRVVLTDARQRVVYSSDDVASLGDTLSSPEFTQPYAIRADTWTGERRLFVATPLVATGGQVSGYVQLSIPMRRIYLQILQTWTGLLLAGGVMLIVTALISLGMAHFILHPIQALTRGASAIAAGDLTQQVRPAGPEETRHLAEAFNRMATQVRETLARQRDFVAHAAHELRTPLTALSLRLEMIQTHGQDNAALTARYLRQMGDEFEHLRRLVDHLLALADLDAHELPTLAALDLSPLLYRLADDLGPLVQAAGHTLRVDVPPHLPPVLVNADQMQAVVRNLLDNAIKYTPSSGTITLSATAMPHEVQIAVADTGPGIPPESLPRIFDRFYRVDKARSRALGGAGLGLSLVKDIVEAYGGWVEVQSEVGQGSRFTLHLPVE
jgi:signal transduction histidine kinase